MYKGDFMNKVEGILGDLEPIIKDKKGDKLYEKNFNNKYSIDNIA